MPQELLRDVLRGGDVTGRARRRMSVLPISIAAHAAAVMVFVIIPLGAEVEIPPIFSPLKADSFIRTAPRPAPPAVRAASPVVQPQPGAPIEAPPDIVKETPIAYPNVPQMDGAIPNFGSGSGAPPDYGLVALPAPALPAATPVQPRVPRVGHGIREPKKIVHVAPEYPEIARRAGVEGTVILEAILDATGRVESVRVLRSQPLLDQAAITAVREWRYSPTELNGVPVPVLMTITVQFFLNR
jgi:periplasmic protein TonB